jgi:hypothetical protein
MRRGRKGSLCIVPFDVDTVIPIGIWFFVAAIFNYDRVLALPKGQLAPTEVAKPVSHIPFPSKLPPRSEKLVRVERANVVVYGCGPK